MSYAYQAAMWCDDCAEKKIAELEAQGVEDTGDTDDYHCDVCSERIPSAYAEDKWEAIYAHDGSDAPCPARCGRGCFEPSGDWYKFERSDLINALVGRELGKYIRR